MCSVAVATPAPVAEVVGLARRLAAAPVDPSVEHDAELRELRIAIDLLELRFARVAADFAEQPRFDSELSDESPLAWLREECHITGYVAGSALAVGGEAEHLPQSVDALTAGEIGFGHLAVLARTSQGVRESLRQRGLPSDGPMLEEGPILKLARRHTVNRFRRDCSHLRHALDPAGMLEEHDQLAAGRYLELRPRDDGCVELEGWLDPVGGAALRTALEPLSRRSGSEDMRTLPRRQEDALVELLLSRLDSGTLPSSGGQRPHLQVTASLAALRGDPGSPAGELELGGPIPSATVQRLACDAAITRIVFGPESVITDVGRSLRVPGPATRRALRSRDGGCVWPGCGRPAPFTAAHHLLHWAHGGATSLSNLVLLCHRHHRAVHEGGWQIARAESGEVVVTPPLPDGFRRPRSPDPLPW